MSFGYALGDLVSAGRLAWDLYHKCYLVIQDAPREFRDLVDSLRSVKITMEDLEGEVMNESSALSRAGEERVKNVIAVVGAITKTLMAVEKIVNRYQIIMEPSGDFKSYGRRLWSKIRWAQEVKAIEDLKQKLMFHTGTITLVLLIVGNASLNRMETIMNTLVTSIPAESEKQLTKLEEDPGVHSTKGLMPTSNNDENGTREVTILEIPHAGEPDDQYPPFYSTDPPQSPGLQTTTEEILAVENIFAEAERKFTEHGRTAPSRKNTAKKSPSAKVTRRPVPTREARNSTASFSSIPAEPPETPGKNITPPPIPPKVRLNSPPILDQGPSNPETLSSSIKYRPRPGIEKVLLNYQHIYYGARILPSNFKLWLRIAEWWFLKGELSIKEQGKLSDQAYIDFVKCSWVLSDIIQQDYDMFEEDLSRYHHLLGKLEMNYAQQDPDYPIPSSNLDSYKVDLEFLEPAQPEEETGVFVSPHHQDLEVFNHIDRVDEKLVFRSFVALEFGLCRPTKPPAETARSYLLALYFSPQNRTAWIYICNQTGTLGIVKSMDSRSIGPELDGSNIRDWIDLEFNGQKVYAGFPSTEAAVPYAVEYNSIRKELLEKPTCLFQIPVVNARYMSRGQEVNAAGIGPAMLALVEMKKAEDGHSRYRQVVMCGHFNTKDIPLHVVKIVQSPNFPSRVQLWWPTFEIPREDLRDYLKTKLNFLPNIVGTKGKYTEDEFYLNPHMRVHRESNLDFATTPKLFVKIRYRTMEERLLDVDLKIESDRMLDVVFHMSQDATEFIRHASGIAPQAKERLIFQKVNNEKEIRLFRSVGGVTRLAYKEFDTYCNFIVDQFSTYKITPEGNVSLWSIIWSPFGNSERTNYSYLTDSIDLGNFSTPERDCFISTLDFPDKQAGCASMKITNFVGVRGGMVGRFAKALSNPRSSAHEAMLVLKVFGDILQITIFGELNYTECSQRGENLKLTAKVVNYAEKYQPSNAAPKLAVRLSVCGAELYSFNRERSIVKKVRKSKLVATEIGGLSFYVNNVSEWRAAVAGLKIERLMISQS